MCAFARTPNLGTYPGNSQRAIISLPGDTRWDDKIVKKGACSMIKEEDLRDALNAVASDMVDLESNPRTWLSWMVYLLARLEEKSTITASDKEAFFEMLSSPGG